MNTTIPKSKSKSKNVTVLSTEALEKIAAEIENRNTTFKSASASEKRILIAKDVIEQINIGKYKPSTGCWVNPKFNKDIRKNAGNSVLDAISQDPEDTDEYVKKLQKTSLREMYMSDNITSCDVCALGGMFMSCTLYNNKTNVEELADGGEASNISIVIHDGDSFSNGLNKFFSVEQLQMIECAYEGGHGAFHTSAYPAEYDTEKMTYYTKYRGNSQRMIAIMENIIKNNGTFVPELFERSRRGT